MSAERPKSALVPEWVIAARGLIDPKSAGPGSECIPASFPPILDGDGMRAVIAPLVAAVAWSGAYFRELSVMSDPAGSAALDPFAMLMRLLALGLSVRALLLGFELIRRIRVAAAKGRCYLALSPEGLYARLPDGEAWLGKDEIAAVVEPGHWQGRRGGRRWSPVYVVGTEAKVHGRDASYLALPPLFLETSGVLAEHLSRWRGAVDEPESPTYPDPETLGSKVYDDAAGGKVPSGTIVVKHGAQWLRAGPYSSLFLALAAADGYLRASAPEREALGILPLVVVSSVAILVPLGWIALTRREIAPRRGLAMVLTPAEVMLRTRAGVLRTRWSTLIRTLVDQKTGWSVLEGIHPRRTLVFKRKNMEPIYYQESFLGVPVEVAQVWLDGYRRGALPPQPPP